MPTIPSVTVYKPIKHNNGNSEEKTTNEIRLKIKNYIKKNDLNIIITIKVKIRLVMMFITHIIAMYHYFFLYEIKRIF